jgi:hypothetical protein
MPYDPATRVLSLSYTRDPEEHADVMLGTARHMVTEADPGLAYGRFIGFAIGLGATVGIVMEIHRRFVLPLILGPADIAPFGIVFVQLLPLVLVAIALYVWLYYRTAKRQRNALIARLHPTSVVDIDIFTKGMSSTNGQVSGEMDWLAVRNIVLDGSRIEIEVESFVVYIPQRAFASHAAFLEGAKEIRDLWREALKREHDSKMIAAGFD